jgi:hypothetical protein
LLLNEVESDAPPINALAPDDACDYVEVRGQNPGGVVPGGTLFLSVNLDAGNPGFVDTAINLGGQVVGSNGTITAVNTLEGPCVGRVYPAGTTLVGYFSAIVIGTGSEAYLLVRQLPGASPIVSGTDIDVNDDGIIDANFGLTVLDGFGYNVDPDSEIFPYGGAPSISDRAGDPDQPDGATRFPGNTTALSFTAWYFGELPNTPPASTTTYTTPLSPNFPVGGALTPGAPNAP